jgi:ribosomal protein S21
MFVTARPGEPFEALYQRFKGDVERSGILREARRRRHFIPKHEERRRRLQAARCRRRWAVRP